MRNRPYQLNLKAAILVEQNKRTLIVDNIKLPEELDIGQVFVEIHM